MEFKIFNDSIIEDKNEREACEELISKLADRLNHFTSGYPKNLILNLHFSRTTKNIYMLTAIIRLNQRTLVIKQSGDNPESIIHTLFNRLKPALSKRLHKMRSEQSKHSKNMRIRSFTENLPELIELKSEGSDDLLKDLLKLLLNDIAVYIRRRLKAAQMTSAVSRGIFKIQELLDEIYLIIYNRLEEIPYDEAEMKVWLHKVVDEYLAEKLNEVVFETENFERIENVLEREYNSLEEEFTIDADYDLIPLEELDDYEDQHPVYSVNQLKYGMDEHYFLDDLITKMNEKEIHEIIEKELMKLPLLKRTIMDLYLLEQLTADEISKIKAIPVSEVEAIVNEVDNQLKEKLSFLV
jgi:DNA-directed RNA polymerase specialized sigma24 family protein